NAAPQMKSGSRCQMREQNVSRSTHVSIHDDPTVWAVESVVASQLLVQLSAATTRLGSIGFITDDHLAVPILSCLVHQPLLKSVVAPCKHLPGCLTADSPLSASHHVARLEFGQKNGFVVAD